MNQHFDYAPLKKEITLGEVFDELTVKPRTSVLARVFILIIMLFLFMFAGIAVVSAIHGSYVVGALLLIVTSVAIAVTISSTKTTIKMKRFAQANNLSYLHGALSGQTGMIFDEGHSRIVTGGYGSADSDHAFSEIANYQYTTGSGKHRQTHHYGFVHMKLPRRLPNMVLDAHKNNLFGRISNLPDTFGSGQKLSLEGDFNTYFTLYAPKEYERDALYVFTPDVMQVLIDEVSGFDMEVIDDDLYLYSSTPLALADPEKLDALFRLIDRLQAEISEQTDYYADERVGNHAANIIAMPGQRLKSGFPILTMLIIAIVLTLQFAPIIMGWLFD